MSPQQAHSHHLRNFMLENLVWQNVCVFWSFQTRFQIWMLAITQGELLFLFAMPSCALARLVLEKSIKESTINILNFY